MLTYTLAWLNGWEIVLILAVVLILFGAKKLPELAKGLGHGIKEFRKASREITDELNSVMDESPPAAPPRRESRRTTPAVDAGSEPPAPLEPAEASPESPSGPSKPD